MSPRRIIYTGLVAIALLLAGCGSAHRPPSATFTKPVSFAILEDYDKGQDLDDVALDFRLMRELGVDTWRGSFGWDDYEPAPGRYDFEWLHRFIELAARHGIRLRPYIGYTPDWAAQGGTDDQAWNDPPRRLDAWARFVDTLATALARHPNVLSYEIYNEQNVPLWWDGTVREYNLVLERGAAAVRAADPDAQVLLGGMVWPDVVFIEATCAEHRNAPAFDIVPFHAYPETWTADTVVVANYLDASYREYFVPAVRTECEGEPIWINEMGYATTPGRTEQQQADWWVRAVATFLADPHVEHIGIYEIKDLPPEREAIGDAPNYHLGLTYADRTKKLAFHTVQMLVRLLNTGTLTVADGELAVRVASGTPGRVYQHLFRRPDGRQVVFAWDRTGEAVVDVTLAAPGSAAIEYALDGTASPYAAFDGRTLRGVRLRPGRARIFEVAPPR